MYKLNNGNGAVVCDSCSIIVEQNLSFKEYVNTHSGWDLCERCKSGITIVDNFDRIASMLEFNDKDEFYFLQIIQRKRMVMLPKSETMVIELSKLITSIV